MAIKYYVVWRGRKPGIYTSWSECEAQVKGFPNAAYKSFGSESEARVAYNGGPNIGITSKVQKEKLVKNKKNIPNELSEDSISVDAACSGNPGVLEFRGVDTKTGEVLFAFGPFPKGTNNIGEFLAVVHALQHFPSKTIYTDSVTAIAWVRNKKIATNLVRDASTEELWQMIDEKLAWLQQNHYINQIVKWNTHKYGDIRADYNRK